MGLGNIYPRIASPQTMKQMNTMKPVQGGQYQESSPLQIGLEEYENILNIDMGAERFIQVFKEASRELILLHDCFTLMPLKQLKLLYTMLYQVDQSTEGGTNVYIT